MLKLRLATSLGEKSLVPLVILGFCTAITIVFEVYNTAMHEISTSTALGNCATCTVSRAGAVASSK